MSRVYSLAAAAFLLLAAGFALGWHFGSLHWKGEYNALVAKDEAQSAKQAAADRDHAQKLRDDYDVAITAISNKYHQDIAASDSAADGLAQQLRAYESRLRALSVPKAADPAAGAHDACPEPGRDPRVESAIERIIKAAGSDADQLTALQAERKAIH